MKEIEELLQKLTKEDFVQEISKNKLDTKGNFVSFFNSNIRTRDSFVKAYKNIVKNIESPESEWYQNKGQVKFKQYKRLLVDQLEWFIINPDTKKWTFTKLGEEVNSQFKEGKINLKEVYYQEVVPPLELSTLWEKISRYNIDILTNDSMSLSEEELTFVTLIHDEDFFQYMVEHGVSEFVPHLKRLGIFKKYKSGGIIDPKTIEDVFKIIREYHMTLKHHPLLLANNPKVEKRISYIEQKNIKRSENEKRKVLMRSKGVCEICKNTKRQFFTKNNRFFSHVHHIVKLGHLKTDQEIIKYDTKKYMINLCPYHHAEIHHGKDRRIFTDAVKVLKLESEDIQDIL